MNDYNGFYGGKKVLVTGGLGFIGLNISRRLLELGASVTVLDNFMPSDVAPPLAEFLARIRVAIADIRLVGITVRDGRLAWAVGDSDRQALARYRAAIDMSDPLRFPADKDWFEPVPCAPRFCVDELLTRTRWSVSPSGGALDAAPR